VSSFRAFQFGGGEFAFRLANQNGYLIVAGLWRFRCFRREGRLFFLSLDDEIDNREDNDGEDYNRDNYV
jgi:hypothetical protein